MMSVDEYKQLSNGLAARFCCIGLMIGGLVADLHFVTLTAGGFLAGAESQRQRSRHCREFIY